MTQYLISFDAHAMDHIPDEDMPAVAKASHAVVQEAINAGVWVSGGVDGLLIDVRVRPRRADREGLQELSRDEECEVGGWRAACQSA